MNNIERLARVFGDKTEPGSNFGVPDPAAAGSIQRATVFRPPMRGESGKPFPVQVNIQAPLLCGPFPRFLGIFKFPKREPAVSRFRVFWKKRSP